MSRSVSDPTSSNVPWHVLDDTEVLARTKSCLQGLTVREAEARLAEYGPNQLPSKPPPGLALIFIHQFLSPLTRRPPQEPPTPGGSFDSPLFCKNI